VDVSFAGVVSRQRGVDNWREGKLAEKSILLVLVIPLAPERWSRQIEDELVGVATAEAMSMMDGDEEEDGVIMEV